MFHLLLRRSVVVHDLIVAFTLVCRLRTFEAHRVCEHEFCRGTLRAGEWCHAIVSQEFIQFLAPAPALHPCGSDGFHQWLVDPLCSGVGLGSQWRYLAVPETEVLCELCKFAAIEWWSFIVLNHVRDTEL